jgi:hypothetical protein
MNTQKIRAVHVHFAVLIYAIQVEETLEAFGIGEDGAQEDKDAGDIDEVDLESLTAVQLKDRCRDLGLKVGGTKAVLLERLRSAWISQIPK